MDPARVLRGSHKGPSIGENVGSYVDLTGGIYVGRQLGFFMGPYLESYTDPVLGRILDPMGILGGSYMDSILYIGHYVGSHTHGSSMDHGTGARLMMRGSRNVTHAMAILQIRTSSTRTPNTRRRQFCILEHRAVARAMLGFQT